MLTLQFIQLDHPYIGHCKLPFFLRPNALAILRDIFLAQGNLRCSRRHSSSKLLSNRVIIHVLTYTQQNSNGKITSVFLLKYITLFPFHEEKWVLQDSVIGLVFISFLTTKIIHLIIYDLELYQLYLAVYLSKMLSSMFHRSTIPINHESLLNRLLQLVF